MEHDCTIPVHGDICVGDRIVFREMVFPAGNPGYKPQKPLGERIVMASIVADSYGEKKQQHTFTLIVLASEGDFPLVAGFRIRRKGRTLHRISCMRAAWKNEASRKAVLDEKHVRGDRARYLRGIRKGEIEDPQKPLF